MSTRKVIEPPLVTLALFSYNQEKFIEAALHGVLSQDYPNLEIVVSDDCSSDATFLIIERIVAGYSGSHTININRNSMNLGLGQHVNRVMDMVNGDLVVLAAGDDISFSFRVAHLVAAWEAAGRPPAICSQATIISQCGDHISARYDGYDGRYPISGETRHKSITRLLEADNCLLLGCTEAWTPRIFDVFGPLNEAIVHEDNAVSLRAWLLGHIVFLEAPLVQYRTHLHNIAYRVQTVPRTIGQFVSRETAYAEKQGVALAHLQQHANDLRTARSLNLISPEAYETFSAILDRRLRLAAMQARWWSLSIHKRWFVLLSEIRLGGFHALAWGLPRAAGLHAFSLGRVCLAAASRVRRSFSNTLKSKVIN